MDCNFWEILVFSLEIFLESILFFFILDWLSKCFLFYIVVINYFCEVKFRRIIIK